MPVTVMSSLRSTPALRSPATQAGMAFPGHADRLGLPVPKFDVDCNVCSMSGQRISSLDDLDGSTSPRRSCSTPWRRSAGRPLADQDGRRGGAGSYADGAPPRRALRRPGGQPPPRSRRPLAPSLGHGFYTIGSAGHEANAFVAAALRPADPALLHYRSGGFYLARAQQVAGHDGVGDILKGLLAAADEPIAGGRHKVFGNADLAVDPADLDDRVATPARLGVAFAIGAAGESDVDTQWPPDALAVCSFGDASLNHSTAQGTINAAAQIAHRRVPLPLLLVCEDNGLGISVPTPAGWVAASLSSRPGLPVPARRRNGSAWRLRGSRGARRGRP